jgi:hypothetical protein
MGTWKVAVSLGFEPRPGDSKSPVLPLHYETTDDLTAVVAVALEKELEW